MEPAPGFLLTFVQWWAKAGAALIIVSVMLQPKIRLASSSTTFVFSSFCRGPSLPHHPSGRTSANRYEKRYEKELSKISRNVFPGTFRHPDPGERRDFRVRPRRAHRPAQDEGLRKAVHRQADPITTPQPAEPVTQE